MKVIIGLGNPGEKYDHTRHNTGLMMVDKLQKDWTFPSFEFNKKFNAEISKSKFEEKEIILVKPQTFMNLSGTSVRAILDFHKITAEDIIVIHDDIDIALGKYKIAADSSSAGHNGVQNIIDQISTQKFCRIRIGVGQTKEDALVCRLDAHDFVLEKFSSEELEIIEKVLGEVLEETKKLL